MRRTDKEVMTLMMGKSPLNAARQAFSFACAALERVDSPIERRRLEFEAVEKIIGAYNGVQVDEG